MVTCLERCADLHMAQLMPLPLTVSCSNKIQIGFTFLVPAYPGCHGKRPLNGCSSSSCHLQADCQEPGSAPECGKLRSVIEYGRPLPFL